MARRSDFVASVQRESLRPPPPPCACTGLRLVDAELVESVPEPPRHTLPLSTCTGSRLVGAELVESVSAASAMQSRCSRKSGTWTSVRRAHLARRSDFVASVQRESSRPPPPPSTCTGLRLVGAELVESVREPPRHDGRCSCYGRCTWTKRVVVAATASVDMNGFAMGRCRPGGL